jgi:pimeloyl-ACP methyl ester carboxylesterase
VTPVLPPEVKALYPFEPHWLELPEGRMHYVDTGGAGPVVVLVHGNPSWSFLWRDLIKELSAAGFRCIAPDHLGMGLSDKPETYFGLADRIRHLETLVDSLGVKAFHLCVHDWGGAIGFGLAGRRPEAVGKLVVTNTAAFRSKHIPPSIAICKIPVFGPFIVRAFNAFAWPATFMAVNKPLSLAAKTGFLLPYDSCKNRRHVANFVRDIPLRTSHRTYATLSEVETNLAKLKSKPMLIEWGGRDFCFNDKFLARWREIFPEATVRHHADAGHYLLEDAGAVIIPEILEFLK